MDPIFVNLFLWHISYLEKSKQGDLTPINSKNSQRDSVCVLDCYPAFNLLNIPLSKGVLWSVGIWTLCSLGSSPGSAPLLVSPEPDTQGEM